MWVWLVDVGHKIMVVLVHTAYLYLDPILFSPAYVHPYIAMDQNCVQTKETVSTDIILQSWYTTCSSPTMALFKNQQISGCVHKIVRIQELIHFRNKF